MLGAILVAGGGLEAWRSVKSLDQPLRLAAPLRFTIPAGARFSRVVGELAGRGLVPSPRAWLLYARYERLDTAIKAGEYELAPGTTPREALNKIVAGQVVLHSLTIVDGWRLEELLAALRRAPDVTTTLATGPDALLPAFGFAGAAAEGQFLPETYRFALGTTDVELLRQAHAALQRVLDAAWSTRDPAIPLHSAGELLAMSSIVEKESGVPAELPKIAGLYLHRLAIGMRLQADPTVIYGLGAQYTGELRSIDLRTDTPYNTYTRVGLPPTPIALAGAAAIQATAHPEKTDALYFVASADEAGTHVFSATLEQHNAAVARYVAKLRAKAAAGVAP